MHSDYSDICDRRIWIYGAGGLSERYINQLDPEMSIAGFVDIDETKHGKIVVRNRSFNCVSISEVDINDGVIVALESPCVISQVKELLNNKHIDWCYIYDAVDFYFNTIRKNSVYCDEIYNICKFIDTTIPVYQCNFKCSYCYLAQKEVELKKSIYRFHDARYIRYCLSRKRIGGIAFINLCGVGETLLCNELYGIVDELIKEGHYLQIVTNTTIKKEIERFCSGKLDPSHLFFKCSFHYLQLKQRGLLNIFSDNVNRLRSYGFSVTIEITPEDAIVPYIDEIKEFSIKQFGALPHITVTRNEATKGFELLSKYSLEKFKEIWSTFDSEMFEFKLTHMNSMKKYNCMAGEWSGELNLATGDYLKCVNGEYLFNIYENPDSSWIEEKVGEKCSSPFCFNNHAYLTFGLIPELNTPTYLEMRNRKCEDGSEWVYGKMKEVFEQKLG